MTHKALCSAIKVIARDACRRLLDLHPRVAAAANVPTAKLIDWMMAFQFDGDVDYFTLDPVAYSAALGEAGMVAYRARLMQIEAGLGECPAEADRWTSQHSHEWFSLDWNARRLAVLDRDVDAIIRTHAPGPAHTVRYRYERVLRRLMLLSFHPSTSTSTAVVTSIQP